MKPINKELVGKRFERIKVLDIFRENYILKAKCKCDCGVVFSTRKQALKTGQTKSCGCLNRENFYKMRKNIKLCNNELNENSLVNCIYADYKCRAKKRNNTFKLTKQLFKKLIFSNCFYCDSVPCNLKTKKR